MKYDENISVWDGATAQDFHLVLEGGAMRGQFSAGVLDYFMEQGLLAKRVYGTSAGALNGLNYVAGDYGRSCFINVKYCTDWRYLSMQNYARTGNAFGVDYLLNTIPNELETYDYDHYAHSPSCLVSVASNIELGEADYREITDLRDTRDLAYLGASASIPLVNKIVEIDGKKLLDGGTCDSVAYIKSLLDGAKKQVVVLTQDATYVKKPNKLMALANARYSQYPLFLERMENRHYEYNLLYRRLARLHEEGSLFVIRPQKPVTVASMESDREKLIDLYAQGYAEAMRTWDDLMRYLAL